MALIVSAAGIAAKRALARNHFVQDRAEAEQIRAVVNCFSAELFRRHIAERAKDHPSFGLDRLGRQRSIVGLDRQGQFGQAEIENLHAAISCKENIVRLQIAVNDALLMRCSQAGCYLKGVFDHFASGDRAAAEPVAQRFAFEQFSDDIKPVGTSADIVDHNDVRMTQRSGGTRLLLEPMHALGVGETFCREDLDCHVAVETRVMSTIHFAHAASAQRRLDLIRSQLCSRGQTHGWTELYPRGDPDEP